MVAAYNRESVKSGGQSRPSQNNAAVDSTSQGLNSLSRWSSNAESVSLSDTMDTSDDKPTGKQSQRYTLDCVSICLLYSELLVVYNILMSGCFALFWLLFAVVGL